MAVLLGRTSPPAAAAADGAAGTVLLAAGDAVGAWFGDKLAAVLFPTAETWDQLKKLAERSPTPPELLLIVNPQWELQVGPSRE